MMLGVPREVRLTSAKQTFMLDCKAAGLSPKTLRGYNDVLNSFIAFAGDMLVRELGPDHVRFYIAELSDRAGHYEGEKFSSHSLMKHYAVVRTWVRWMYAQKIITDRVTDFVKPPRLSSRLPSILTDGEIDDLFADLKKSQRFRDLVIFELFLDTGLRLDEVVSLSVDDVNIDGGWVRVVGKGDVEDIVPIGARVCRDLYAYIHMHRQPAHETERTLFLSAHGPTTGYGLTYEAMSKMVSRELGKIRTQSGKRGAHVMRHTAGTNMIRGGASTEHVRRILRHRDGRITQVYLHLANEDLLEAHRAASPIDRRQTRSRRPKSSG
jgi:site-specific recombinase XerD